MLHTVNNHICSMLITIRNMLITFDYVMNNMLISDNGALMSAHQFRLGY